MSKNIVWTYLLFSLKFQLLLSQTTDISKYQAIHFDISVVVMICSNSFSHCKADQKKTVAISQMFYHVQ